MAKYFTTWGFPHGGKKKPVLLLGPEKPRDEHQKLLQYACQSRTNPDFERIDLLCSTGGVSKKKRFEKGPYKARESVTPIAETGETAPETPSQEGTGSATTGPVPENTPTPPGPDAPAGDSEDNAPDLGDGGEEE